MPDTEDPKSHEARDRKKNDGDDIKSPSGSRHRSHRSKGSSRSSGEKHDSGSHEHHRSSRSSGGEHKSSRSSRTSTSSSDLKSPRSARTSDRDREAKRRAREGRSEGTVVKPGVVSVTDSAGSRRERDKISGSSRRSGSSSLPEGAPLTKEERRSKRAQEEQDAKRRAKEGRSGSGVSSSHRSSGVSSSHRSTSSRDDEIKRRAREGRSSGPSLPGAQMAASRGSDKAREKSMQGGRPGASSSRGSDNKKNLEQVKSEHDGAKPAATIAASEGAGGDGEVAVEAVAIDEAAEENERMRQLEEQNRELARRMEQLANDPQPVPNNEEGGQANHVKGGDEDEVNERAEKARKKKRNICILVCLLVAAGIGAAVYFVTKKDDAPPATTPKEITPAPSVLFVPATQSPSQSSEGPSSSPTIDTYDPPSLQDCVRIKSGLPVEGQEDLDTKPFRMAFDIKLTDPDLDAATWVPSFKDGIDDVLIPALAGCPIGRRLETIDQGLKSESGLRKLTSKTAEHAFQRELQKVESTIRYVIANAKANIDPNRDVTDNCEIKREGCNNVRVIIELFLKGEEKSFNIITLIAQVLQALIDLDDSDNRLLKHDEEPQHHHRKLLVGILGLDSRLFESIGFRGTEQTEPTTAPSAFPTFVPSKVPTASPTGLPTKKPSPGPTTPPTPGPTPNPTDPPTPGPTPNPTDPPTPGPTAPPTPGPTPPPTPGPTFSPTSRPVVVTQPTNRPTPQPVFQPVYYPPDPTWYPTPDYYSYSETPYSETPYTEWPTYFMPPLIERPYVPVGDDYYSDDYFSQNCGDADIPFVDQQGNDCSWYTPLNDDYGCPNHGANEGRCEADERNDCNAATACCHCKGNPPGCIDDWHFRDSYGDGCSWYEQYNTAGSCTNYGGTCMTWECVASDACCLCYL